MEKPLFKREIFSSFKLFDKLTIAFPKRTVIADRNIDHDEFCYFGADHNVRRVNAIDRSIWVCDFDRGFPFMKCIR